MTSYAASASGPAAESTVSPLPDDLVGPHQQRLRNRQADVASRLEVDYERVLCGLFPRQIGGAANAILFFDEADALFGKRTDVHGAHDRYGNVEVSYLLTKLEAYPEPAILVTSSRMNVDPAFLRLVQHVLYFDAPLRPSRP